MKRNLLIMITFLGMLVACEPDNYELPDGELKGSVIDVITGNPIQTEQPNGYRIKYKEISWGDNVTDQYLWGKPDGTFQHSKLFEGTYEISAVEGAFVDTETQVVDIKSNKSTTVDFIVTPYISFKDVEIIKKDASSVNVTFTILKNIPGSILQDYQVFVSSKTKYVGINPGGSEANISIGVTPLSEEDLNKPLSVVLNNLEKGEKYYIRIGARCQNPSNRYNMTEVYTIQM